MAYKIRGEILKDSSQKSTWYARVRYRDDAGKVREKKRTCRTRESAKIELPKLTAIVESELRPQKTYADLDAFFRREYLTAARFTDGKKVAGYKQNHGSIIPLLDTALDYFGPSPLPSITYEQVRQYKAEVEATPAIVYDDVKRPPKMRTVATINHYLKWLRRLFNIAIEQGWLDVSPFKRGRPLIVAALEVERTRILTPAEETALLSWCVGRREHLASIIVFGIETGCRKGEIMSLTWKQVDLENSCITINATNTKTEKPRMVPVTDRLKAVLESLQKKRSTGKVFTTGEFQDSFRRACEKAKLPDVHFHDLRHTAITRMLEKGVPQPLVMKISGHTNIKTFLRYVNPTPASIAAIAQQLSR
ncbi:MAG: tyrosine-type recombinase/integrase [Pyrinomonadaceae bacterium]